MLGRGGVGYPRWVIPRPSARARYALAEGHLTTERDPRIAADMLFRAGLSGCGGALVALVLLAISSVLAADAKPSPDQIEVLVRQLGDDDYFTRQRAKEALARIGIPAFDALAEAESSGDFEIASQAAYLMRLINVPWIEAHDSEAVKQRLEGYESADERRRWGAIAELLKLPDDEGLLAVCRVARFEKSQLLAKRAALAVIEQPAPAAQAWPRRVRAIEAGIDRSPRPAAQWLRTHVAARDNLQAGVAGWTKAVELERRVLKSDPGRTSNIIVLSLLKQQASALRRIDRQSDALGVMEQMVDLPQNAGELLNLVEWLAEQQAWTVIDMVAARHDDSFRDFPLLLYAHASAQRQQGKSDSAAQTVERARELNRGRPDRHLDLAEALNERGMFEWAEDEYRATIAEGDAGDALTLQAQMRLAEMLFDQAREHDAAVVLEESCRMLEKSAGPDLERRLLSRNKARMHYFFACDAEKKGDRKLQVRHLLDALDEPAEKEYDVDVLIALYRVPDLDKPIRERTLRLVNEAADEYRMEIARSAEDALPYNQLAWLISNTEGDYREALRCSEKSLQLRPDEPGFLDTLGRCHYAVGDLDNAVKSQARAVQLDPHKGVMRRQLEFFEAERAKKKGA